MLVDAKFHVVTEKEKQRIIDSLGYYNDFTPKRISKGLFWTSLNFELHFAKDVKINDHPEFSKQNVPWLNQMKDRLETATDESDISYIESMIKCEESKPLKTYENKRKCKKLYDRTYDSFCSYGVVDKPNQLFRYYDLIHDPRKFCVGFTPVFRKDQPNWGGWRWHKWGPYLGTQKQTTEYLYDEKHIDYVLLYHIIEIKE